MFRKHFSVPTVFILLVFGVFIGTQIRAISEDNIYEQMRKFNDVLSYTQKHYVEDVKVSELVESAVIGMLKTLDPHSVYIPPKHLKKVQEEFKGSFEGIGIEFSILHDTIRVGAPIFGGPSEKVGLQSGDKIVNIDGETAVGFKNEDVMKKLRGEKGTKVVVDIARSGVEDLLTYTIIRDKIPLYTVDSYFLIDDEIGYMSVNRFAANTYSEFIVGLRDMRSKGMKKLILDLRYNPGGYLEQAFRMANEFLGKGEKIVFTKSRNKSGDENYMATGTGEFQGIPLIVLIGNASASASEIVAGAVQDHDRGLIVGTTSFGKGLVQRQFDLSDGSAFRLTIARYYTPSGRLIQRDYEGKSREDYYKEARKLVEEDGNNIDHTSEDSDTTKPKFKTTSGRTVFGGGGITPDYIVESDKLQEYTAKLRTKLYEFLQSYMDSKRPELNKKYPKDNLKKFMTGYTVSDDFLKSLIEHGEEKDVEFNEEQYNKDKETLKILVKAQVARSLFGNEGFFKMILKADSQFMEAIQLFPEAKKIAGLE
jgi:carboxyl-terminal processing protease